MSIQQEIKSQLAKLLATEDLIVEHKQVETASFNVESRVLVLPLWEKASSEVYDMLVAHEVGHALFTPCEDWLDRYDIPPSFVNIVEDARIEKLMKRKYAGLPKTFFIGYKELQGMDFFKLSDIDVNEMGIADRLNLYFKVGNFIDIDFTDYEKTLVSMVKSAETFDDVLEYSKVIWEYAKEELEQKKKEQQEIEEMKAKVEMEDGDGDNEKEYKTTTQGTEGDSEKSDVESEDELEDEDDDDGLDYDDQAYSKGGITLGDEPKAETVENLEESLKDLVNQAGRETLYVEKPNDLDLDKVIIPNWFIHKNIDFEWRENTASDFFNADKEFDEFRVSARKEVNYLVKEFEMKKSASAYARAATARTGMLDMSKLHTYQYCEDIFKKVTVLPDGKNHGLVFILDWSGSMSYIMKDTIKQLYNLIWFCRKVQIPFDVYAFTNCHPYHNMRESRYTAKNNIVCIEESFSLMNLFTSKVNVRTLDHQMRNIYRMATRFGYSHVSWDDRDRFQVPIGMGLSGTPLDESLICLHQIIPQFKKDNKVEKVQCVVLTDGEAYTPSFHNEVQRHWEDEPYMGRAAIWSGTFLRDRKLGKTYRVKDSTFGFTEVLLDNLKDTFPSVNFMVFVF